MVIQVTVATSITQPHHTKTNINIPFNFCIVGLGSFVTFKVTSNMVSYSVNLK